MDTFARNSGLDVQRARDRHFEVNPSCFGCGELSVAALRRRITKWATDTGRWVCKGRPKAGAQVVVTSGK